MKKTIIILIGISILSKMLGLGRDLTLSYFYGASNLSDAYIISITITGVLLEFIVVGISTGYIPIYRSIEVKSGEETANRYTNNVINVVLLLCTLILVFSLIYTPQLVKLFASGFKGETLELAIKFTRIGLAGVYFLGILNILTGYLQSKNCFVIPGLIGFPYNIVIIGSIIISYYKSIYFLAIGSVIAVFSQVLLLLIFSYMKGFRYRPRLDLKDENLRSLIYLAIPVILGSSTDQINQLVNKTLASQIAIGGISALSYAHQIDTFIQGIFVVSISAVLYPQISKMAAEHDIIGMKKNIGEAITCVNLFVVPAAVGAMIFSVPIISLLFARGAFDDVAVTMTANALVFYAIGMVGIGNRKILNRAFYSLQDTKTPMINSTIAIGINIALSIMLSKVLGIGGLALATSISATITMILMFVSLRKKIGQLGIKKMSIAFLKILLASILMGLLAKTLFSYSTTILGQSLALFIAIALGAVSYFVIIYFIKIEEVDVITAMIKDKLSKGEA